MTLKAVDLLSLRGRTALVTGATSGIGRAIALELSQRGARVAVNGRDARRGADTVRAIEAAGGAGLFIPADLEEHDSSEKLAEAVTERMGHVDVLVNNAGVFTFDSTAKRTHDDFSAMVDVNLRAPFFLTAALAPLMAKRGWGSIVNISSGAAVRGTPSTSLYGASKAALNFLTLAWAAEYGPFGVRVNGVSPGMVRTEGTILQNDHLDAAASKIPARRLGHSSEIAQAVAFLASDSSSYMHGVVMPVDGGATAT